MGVGRLISGGGLCLYHELGFAPNSRTLRDPEAIELHQKRGGSGVPRSSQASEEGPQSRELPGGRVP